MAVTYMASVVSLELTVCPKNGRNGMQGDTWFVTVFKNWNKIKTPEKVFHTSYGTIASI